MCVNEADEGGLKKLNVQTERNFLLLLLVDVQSEKESINKLMKNMPKLADMFDVHHISGEGTFSSVYLGTLKHKKYGDTRKKFAIKHIIPTSHPNRIIFELKCLKLLG